MKKLSVFIGLALAALAIVSLFRAATPKPKVGGDPNFFYTSATLSTSSVSTTWSASPVLSASSARGFVSLCNDSASSAIYLGLGGTTTVSSLGMAGVRIGAGACYELTLSKMFYGNIYAVASPTAATLLKVEANY